MPRRKAPRKRAIMEDPLFNSELVTKLINTIQRDGKKSCAERIVYNALGKVIRREGGKVQASSLSENERKHALDILEKALGNVKPLVEVKSRRVGGSTYQVPVEVRPERREAVGMRFLATSAAVRSEKSMEERLAGEILDAVNLKGAAVKKREDTHRMAEANKAFAHYRW